VGVGVLIATWIGRVSVPIGTTGVEGLVLIPGRGGVGLLKGESASVLRSSKLLTMNPTESPKNPRREATGA